VSIWLKAVEILETNGWCRGAFNNEKGEYCMVGALAKAWDPELGIKNIQFTVFLAGINVKLRRAGVLGDDGPFIYNDTHTKEEIIQLLTKMHAMDASK